MSGATGIQEIVRPATVDDYLGNGERRFFGEGYKRAVQWIRDITLDAEPDGTIRSRARAAVRYPADWSRKGTVDQRPHLSSIDVLLIAGEMAEVGLTHTLGLTTAERRALRLRSVRLKSGRAPVEAELDDFPVTATLRRSERNLTVADCQVGALRAELSVWHPARAAAGVGGRYPSPDALLGPPRTRPFAGLHKLKRQRIDGLAVDVAARTAQATVGVDFSASAGIIPTGLESYSHAAVSIVDTFVSAIQLGQILLYQLDGLDRASSNTLWMRQTVLGTGTRSIPVHGPCRLDVWLEGEQLLRRSPQEAWRSADIVARLADQEVRCSVAHRLP